MTITALGYLGFKANDLDAWSEFGAKVLGLMPVTAPDGTLRFRVDDQAWRISIEPGDDNDIAYAGFEVASASALDNVAGRLRAAGVDVGNGDPDLLKLRGVTGMITCRDPDGLALEIFYGPTVRREIPFASPTGITGFLTGEQGLGHIVLAASDIEKARAFYCGVLGFKLSDIIHMQLTPEFAVDLEFFHCNPRHHTIALAQLPSPRRLHHFMLQAVSLDDVGFTLDRIGAAGFAVTNSLGKHPNDQMVSFYAQTPSGFEVEYGWGANVITEDWRVVRHDKTSVWGHKRPQ